MRKKELYVLQHGGCDYVSLLQNLKNRGSWLVLTGDDMRAEGIIKASRKVGAYVRVYRLDIGGKLRYYRSLDIIKKVFHVDAFTMPNQISTIRKVMRKSRTAPITNDVVYTSDN